MNGAPKSEPEKSLKRSRADIREARLKAALKANMGRRKAQARARANDDKQDGQTGLDNDNE